MSYADEETSKMLAELQKRIEEVYETAWSEVGKTASDYFAILKDRYEEQYKAYEEGKYTKEQFEAWYLAQVGRGKRWEELRDQLAADLTRANEIAAAYINDTTPGIYSLNANYTAWEIYGSTGVDFTLVDANTIKELLMSDNLMLPPSRVPIPVSEAWNSRQLTNALVSGILQGKSIGKIADEFERVVNMDRTSALRNARTATTGAQNAGRQDTYNRAVEMGIEMVKEWIATEDGRTRDSHAELDGVRVKVNEKFPNGLEYPGDRSGRPEEVYNCRCTVRAVLPKYEDERASEIEGHEGEHSTETYKEWEDRKREERMNNSKPYTYVDGSGRGMEAAEERAVNLNADKMDYLAEFKPQYGEKETEQSYKDRTNIYNVNVKDVTNSKYQMQVDVNVMTRKNAVIRATERNLDEFHRRFPDIDIPRVIICDFDRMGCTKNPLGGYYNESNTLWINSKYGTIPKIEEFFKMVSGEHIRTDWMSFYEHELKGHKVYYDYLKLLANNDPKMYNIISKEKTQKVIEVIRPYIESKSKIIPEQLGTYCLTGIVDNEQNIFPDPNISELIAECSVLEGKPLAQRILDAFYGD